MLSIATQTKFLTAAFTFAPRRVYGIAPRPASCQIMQAREDAFYRGISTAFSTLTAIMPLSIDCHDAHYQYAEAEYGVWRELGDDFVPLDASTIAAELKHEIPADALHSWAAAIDAQLDLSPEERAAMLDAEAYASAHVHPELGDLPKIENHGCKLYLLAALLMVEAVQAA